MDELTAIIEKMTELHREIEQKLLGNNDYTALREIERLIQNYKARLDTGDVRSMDRAESQCDAAEAVLKQIGEPMTTIDLMNIVESRGVRFGGANRATNFSSALSRDKRFQSLHWRSSRRWWLAGIPLPEKSKANTQYAMA